MRYKVLEKVDNIGFFTMDCVNAVLSSKTLEEAKQKALIQLKSIKNPREHNLIKAQTMIDSAKTTKDLALKISNFILAHPSERLKTLSFNKK